MKTIGHEKAQRVTKKDFRFLRIFVPFCGYSVWSVCFVVLIFPALARAVEITLPPETAKLVESPLPGYQLAVASCATCHSMDYVKMQPTSSRTYWKASVTKMQKTFGAPIPDDVVEPIVDYLVKTYGNERPGGGSAARSSDKPAANSAKK
jgi:sulfite dehydrogenase